MATHKQLFGTDGVRGVPGEFPLDDRTLRSIGHALGRHARAGGQPAQILIGMDTRESGPAIAMCLADGIRSTGNAPVFAGVLTTPGVACLVRELGCAAGLVVSASHNPYTDNGVKLIAGTGMKFPDRTEAQIEESILAFRESDESGVPWTSAGLKKTPALTERYLEFLRARIIPAASLAGMRIVLDCANGAASKLGPELFRSLGADVMAIHNTPDGRNINAGCGSLHPENLLAKVVETGASLGVAFDGDADRAIFASASGKRVDGDGILLAMARYMKSAGTLKGSAVVGTTMANLGLEKALAIEGLALTRTPVGDRYVLEEMLRTGCNLGGEQSGHIIFTDDATTGDGLLTALKIAGLVALRGPLDSLIEGLKIFPQTIVNVRVREKPSLNSVPPVAAALAQAERALKGRGRINLRYSGTEPLARVMVEAETESEVARWSAHVAEAVRAALGA
jgi:phosphoglucosamine mutase